MTLPSRSSLGVVARAGAVAVVATCLVMAVYDIGQAAGRSQAISVAAGPLVTRELQAQRDAAEWAFWAMVIAAVQLPVGALGLFALLRSLRQTDRSLEEAKEANRLARAEMLIANRPWVFIEDVRNERFDPDIFIVFKNVGTSVARAFTKDADVEPMRRPFPVRVLLKPREDNATTLPPGATEIISLPKVRRGDGAELVVRIALSYQLPDGTFDFHYEAFACGLQGGVRKVTGRDFLEADD